MYPNRGRTARHVGSRRAAGVAGRGAGVARCGAGVAGRGPESCGAAGVARCGADPL